MKSIINKEELNNTCILFNSEAEKNAIIQFYIDNGYGKDRNMIRMADEDSIGVLHNTLDFWNSSDKRLTIIKLYKED